ncbi:MAG: hypothetical protein ACKVLH_05620 [Bacteroidia bacterium]|jgi:hypothetical protein|nr:hypothetical protein [Bacteroidia bacterium]|tara:strand:- start:553 stop:681 length:129 start_codon:yes stop_codon:yes gene_type:complete
MVETAIDSVLEFSVEKDKSVPSQIDTLVSSAIPVTGLQQIIN